MDEGARAAGGEAGQGGVATWMDDSVRASVQARVLHEAMALGRVPAGALYASPFQALRWLSLHEAWSPARRDAGVLQAYDEVFGDLAERLEDGPWVLASLGCGGGQKEDRFLSRARRRPGSALVVDVSPSLALGSHDRVSRWCPTHAGVMDLEVASGPSGWCEALMRCGASGGRCTRVVTLLGMLPNMDLAHARRVLEAWTAPGDWVVLSANLASEDECMRGLPTILPQYDNEETRRWLSGFLEWQGIRAGSFGWEYGVERLPSGEGGMARITVDAVLREPAFVQVPGHEGVRWAAGERVRVFQSLRMTLDAARRFGTSMGWRVVRAAADARGEEGVVLLQRLEGVGERGE